MSKQKKGGLTLAAVFAALALAIGSGGCDRQEPVAGSWLDVQEDVLPWSAPLMGNGEGRSWCSGLCPELER